MLIKHYTFEISANNSVGKLCTADITEAIHKLFCVMPTSIHTTGGEDNFRYSAEYASATGFLTGSLDTERIIKRLNRNSKLRNISEGSMSIISMQYCETDLKTEIAFDAHSKKWICRRVSLIPKTENNDEAKPIDLNALANDIHSDAQKTDAPIIIDDETSTDILTDDLEEGRPINYHIVAPTKEWLENVIVFASDAKQFEPVYKTGILNMLMKTDPNMLITLRRIAVINSIADICAIEAMCKDVGESMLPDDFDFDEDEDDSVLRDAPVGMFWSWESTVIINMQAITAASKEIDDELTGEYGYSDYNGVERDGVFVTLLHEIRHLGLANPYLPEEHYNDDETTENAVEQWARDEYNRILYEAA